MSALVEEIDDVRIGEGLTRPSALAHPTYTVQKKAALRRVQKPAVLTRCHHEVIFPCKMTAWYRSPLACWLGSLRLISRITLSRCFQNLLRGRSDVDSLSERRLKVSECRRKNESKRGSYSHRFGMSTHISARNRDGLFFQPLYRSAREMVRHSRARVIATKQLRRSSSICALAAPLCKL